MLLTLTKRFHQWLGPLLLKHGLKARCWLGGGVVTHDNLFLDNVVGLQLAKRLVSLDLREAQDRAVAKASTSADGSKDEGIFSTLFGWWSRMDDDSTATASDSSSSALLMSPYDEGKIRLSVLEKYLRPALVPHEKWSDVQKWQFHKRLIQWIRQEYLYAAHIAQVRASFLVYPQLANVEQLAPKGRTVQRLLAGGKLKLRAPFWDYNTTRVTTTSSTPLSRSTDRGRAASSPLPSTTLIQKAFGLSNWANKKVKGDTYNRMAPIVQRLGGSIVTLRGGALCLPHFSTGNTHDDDDKNNNNNNDRAKEDVDLSSLSLGEIMELVHGHVKHCGPLNLACEERNIYQLWTREYIQGLGHYLQIRAEEWATATTAVRSGEEEEALHERTTLILEVGAGDGLLAASLRDFFENNRYATTETTRRHNSSPPLNHTAKKSNRQNKIMSNSLRRRSSSDSTTAASTKIAKIIATDDSSWRISFKSTVEKLGYQRALEKYCATDTEGLPRPRQQQQQQQVIVLCSWMPMNEDWSATFRKHQVQEYILIGECDDGQCGDNWETWGNHHMRTSEETTRRLAQELEDQLDKGGRQPQQHGDQHNCKTTTSTTTNYNNGKKQEKKPNSDNPPIPPHVQDGYIRHDLTHLAPHQFSRFDCSTCKAGTTVSFRLPKSLSS